jgi:3-isopropylmalate/(R)-2-methylmalate dehydratase small subunit
MQAFTKHNGLVATMDRSNVDTDQIIPKQFLKRIERTGFGQYLFFDWRFLADGSPNPAFELNFPENRGASILVARRNFGSGSSREHAVWAIDDFGIRAVIAESYSDIFYNNCFKNGILPVVLAPEAIQQIFDGKSRQPGYRLTIDLDKQVVTDGDAFKASFEIDPVRKDTLYQGLDDIGLTLLHEDKITAFEKRRNMASAGS